MNEMEAERSYSGWERFLFFVTPILFTIALLVALLVMFNADVRNRLLAAGNEIPIVGGWLPSPQLTGVELSESELRNVNFNEKIDELETLLGEAQANLSQATAEQARLEEQVAQMGAELEQLEELQALEELGGQQGAAETNLMDNEAYAEHIRSLASMYGQMQPSRAAPILQRMELEEMALILQAMSTEERVRVLERLNPQAAADVTIKLKDMTSVRDMELAALQARIRALEEQASATVVGLADGQINATFSTMAPADAAALLLKLTETDSAKALKILSTVGDGPRAQILAELGKLDERVATNLVARLVVQ